MKREVMHLIKKPKRRNAQKRKEMSGGSLCNDQSVFAVGVLYEMISKKIGVHKSAVCTISREEEEVFSTDIVDILTSLNMQHPVGQYIVEILQCHSDMYGCGGTSLLFMIGQMCKKIQQLMTEGISLLFIEGLLNEAVEDCINGVKALIVPVETEPSTSLEEPTENLFHQSVDTFVGQTREFSQQALDQVNCTDQHNEYLETDIKNIDFIDSQLRMTPGQCSNNTTSTSDCEVVSLVQKGTMHSYERYGSHSAGSFCLQENLKQKLTVSDLNGFLKSIGGSAKPPDALLQRVVLGSRNLQCLTSEIGVSGNDINTGKETNNSTNEKIISNAVVKCGIFGSDNSNDVMCPNAQIAERVACHKTSACDQSQSSAKRYLLLFEEADRLNHGGGDMMIWAKKAILHQLDCLGHSSSHKFNTHLIHTCLVKSRLGPPKLLDGLVLAASNVAMEVVLKLTHPVSVMLFIGDLTANYRHVGYQKTMTTAVIVSSSNPVSQDLLDWQAQVIAILKKLEVQAVFAKGSADRDLMEAGAAAGIAVIDRVPFRLLQAIQSASCAEFVSYALDAHEGNVCKDILLKPVDDCWSISEQQYLLVTLPVVNQTLVILSPCAADRFLKEAEFCQCLDRLTQAFQDKKVLPGEAETEQWCEQFLRQDLSSDCALGRLGFSKWSQELALYRPVVRATLADAFQAYVTTVKSNRLKAGTSDTTPKFRMDATVQLCPTSDCGACGKSTVTDLQKRAASSKCFVSTCSFIPDKKIPKTDEGGQVTPAQNDATVSLPDRGRGQDRQQEYCALSTVYDNYSSKINGWRTAMHCAATVLKMDNVITTGVHQKSAENVL